MGLTAASALLLLGGCLAAAPEFFVAPNGSDAGPGTAAQPFASLTRARDAARGQAATITLRGGSYPVTSTIALGAADSRITWRARPGETVRLTGGRALSAAAFQPVTDPAVLARLPEESRGQVRQIDLKALGITQYGQMGGAATPELFINGQAQTLARYPNTGWLRLEKVIDRGSVWGSNVPGDPELHEKPDRGAIFELKDPHLARWKTAEDLWLHGFWWWDWADQKVKVDRIDLDQRLIKTVQPHTYGYRAGGRYYAFNLLEEIDRPGEWYLDRGRGRLYLYPPTDLSTAEIELSLLDQPMFVLTGASQVTFRGLTLETSRAGAMVINGGADCRVAACTFRKLAAGAVSVNGGTHHVVSGCDIYDVNGGISLSGGDRKTLTPGRHEALNNHLYNYSRLSKCYCTALSLYGVGLRAAYNRVHNAPHMGLGFGGNDHVIEFNEFYDVCRETSDCGVIYAGRNWSMRGNVIRYNFIHDIYGLGDGGAEGIYLDDCFSSADVIGNVLANLKGLSFLIGGGRDNVIENNLTVRTGPLHLDDRGLGWAKRSTAPDGDMPATLKQMPYQSELWRQRYPKLTGILDDNPGCPKGNVVRRNVWCWTPEPQIAKPAREFGTIADNWVTREDPGLTDLAKLDLRLRADSAVFKQVPGFQAIPFEQIGLRADEDRAVVPPIAPAITPNGGAFAVEQQVSIGTRSPGAVVRYTLDGSDPTAHSPVCTGPVKLTATSTLRAAAFAGPLRSDVTEARFTVYPLGHGQSLPLSLLPTAGADGYAEPKVDTNMAGQPIKLRGKTYPHGLTLHPKEQAGGGRGFAIYALDGGLRLAKRFKATVGVEDSVGPRGSVGFIVELRRNGQWQQVYASPVLKGGGATAEVDVDLSGAEQLKLVVTDGGDNIHADHGAWADARLE